MSWHMPAKHVYTDQDSTPYRTAKTRMLSHSNKEQQFEFMIFEGMEFSNKFDEPRMNPWNL